jgi:hypothetical protein
MSAPSPAVHALLLALTDAQLGRLLRHCRDWNTHGRHALVAHRLLAALFRTRRPAALQRLPELKEVLPALVPYTERHFARLDTLLQKSFLCVKLNRAGDAEFALICCGRIFYLLVGFDRPLKMSCYLCFVMRLHFSLPASTTRCSR